MGGTIHVLVNVNDSIYRVLSHQLFSTYAYIHKQLIKMHEQLIKNVYISQGEKKVSYDSIRVQYMYYHTFAYFALK